MTTPLPLPPTTGNYISLPVTTDPDTLNSEALSYLATSMPGWTPRDGHLEVWVIQALARMVAETAQVASTVPLSIFQYFGQSLLNLPPIIGAPAQMQSTWTLNDSAGHTIPAGTQVAYPVTPSTSAMFTVAASVTVPSGQNTTAAGGVTLIAQKNGGANNGLAATNLTLVDNLAWVSTVASTTASSGGVDAEVQSAYLNRLRAELALLSPRPILPSDFAALALNQPGVSRATAVDGYNPADGSSGNARMVTVACTDSNGNALTAAQNTTVANALQAAREVNFIVNVVAPSYTTVNVAAQVVALPGQSINAVTTAVSAAIVGYLNPANWGGPSPSWHNITSVRQLALVGVISQIAGVGYVSGVQLASTGSLQPQDLPLSGVVPLPRAGTITVNVTAGT